MEEVKYENNDAFQNQSDHKCGGPTIAHSSRSTHTEVDEETHPEVILVEDIEIGGVTFGGNDAYLESYRNGNFGVKRGRVNFTRAKVWSFVHFFTVCLITCFNVGCIFLLSDNYHFWISDGFVDCFEAFSPLCCFLGLLTSSGGVYFSIHSATLRRPLFVLLFVRLLALLECILVIPASICTTVVASKARSQDPWWLQHTSDRKQAFNGLCGGLLVLMLVDWITALVWLFHWWKCCAWCHCFKSWCIFEPGEPLAPGVPDPPTGFLHECVYVLWVAMCRNNWTLI